MEAVPALIRAKAIFYYNSGEIDKRVNTVTNITNSAEEIAKKKFDTVFDR